MSYSDKRNRYVLQKCKSCRNSNPLLKGECPIITYGDRRNCLIVYQAKKRYEEMHPRSPTIGDDAADS